MIALVATLAFADDPQDVDPVLTRSRVLQLAPSEEAEKAYEDQRTYVSTAPNAAASDVRVALAFGDYETARTLAIPLADASPMDPDLAALVGLAWMGTYYSKYGLSEAAYERVSGAAIDPAGALSAGPLLSDADLARALARGFAVPGQLPSSVRGGSTVPAELLRAEAAFAHAVRLAPSDPGVLLDRFVVEAEIAHWGGDAPDLALHRGFIEKQMRVWSIDERALAEVDLGVASVLAGDVSAGLAAFLRAEALGSPLGSYDAALLYASSAAVYDADAAALRFRALASADRAQAAGLLPNATAWPLGAGRVQLVSSDPAVVALADLVRAYPTGVNAVDLADGTRVIIAGGAALAVVDGDASRLEANGGEAVAETELDADTVVTGALALGTTTDSYDDVAVAETVAVSRGGGRYRFDLPRPPVRDRSASRPTLAGRADNELTEGTAGSAEGFVGGVGGLTVGPATRAVQIRTFQTCPDGVAGCLTLLEVRPSE